MFYLDKPVRIPFGFKNSTELLEQLQRFSYRFKTMQNMYNKNINLIKVYCLYLHTNVSYFEYSQDILSKDDRQIKTDK